MTTNSTNLFASQKGLNVSYYLPTQKAIPLNETSLNVSHYLPSKYDSVHSIPSLTSNKLVIPEPSLEKYRSTKWNGKQIGALAIGSACIIGLVALSVLINPYIILAAPLVILTTMLAIKKLSGIDYKMVNIEEKTITLSRQEIKLISDVKLPDMKLPDFEFVRYILAGGDYQELLQEADRLVDAHLADDEYLGNLLSNLQIARMAHEEACYRHHLKDPISYSKEKMKVDIEAANIAFVEFKEDLMQKAL